MICNYSNYLIQRTQSSIDEYPSDYFEYPGDPVNLLSGSMMWEYTDFALYGRDDLEFTRYYSSMALIACTILTIMIC